MNEELTTEEKIKLAAKKIFMQKGLAGARMQDIADEAEINKAMLHYYFKNKQHLFDMIFEEKLGLLFSALGEIVTADVPFREKVAHFVDRQSDIVSDFPSLPLFILSEAWQNPGLIQDKLKDKPLDLVSKKLKADYERAVTPTVLKEVPFAHFMLNMISLILYPVMGEPIFKGILSMSPRSYAAVLKQRKKMVTEVLLASIKLD